MIKTSYRLVSIFLFIFCMGSCATKKHDTVQVNPNVFQVSAPDYERSPFTGLTREHWVQAANYILNGAFSYVHTIDDAMKFPKQPGKTYPHTEAEVPTEKLEGLCRTLFVAAPLLKEDSNLVLNGIRVSDYYRHNILKLVDPTSESYIVPRAPDGGPNQNLVEFGALAISLFVVPEVIWEPLTQPQKDALAATMLSYGDGPTVPSNWKFFNIFVLSFFKDQGYVVNEELLKQYLSKSLEHYRGQGWYNDAPAYDYYSMWAFQLYGVVWSEVFGKSHYPEIAEQFIQNFTDLQDNYPNLFAQNGNMIMWGRSISYRFASVAPFAFMGSYGGNTANLGWYRHIASSTLLQFLQHPNLMKDSVPTLGFYGPYEPAVQNYSCRGSVFWMGKAFLGLLLPGDNPFWTAVENEGPWSTYKKDSVYNKFAEGSGTLITNYPEIGASEIRAWCHEKVKDDWQKFRSSENYNRLSYNSAFLWQADGLNGEVAMNYALKNADTAWEVLRLYTFMKYEHGTYYRDVELETSDAYKMNLADIPLSNGILRIDRNISTANMEMRLGHYALPEFDVEIKTTVKQTNGYTITLIDNGKYQLAIVPLLGWDSTTVVRTNGLNPERENSSILTLMGSYNRENMKAIYASLMLWKKSGESWTNNELMPLKSIAVSDNNTKVTVVLKNGMVKQIVF